jgi:hypothetical protein
VDVLNVLSEGLGGSEEVEEGCEEVLSEGSGGREEGEEELP